MKSTLVLIDFINEILDEKGKLANKGYASFAKEHDLFDKARKAIEVAHKNDILVVFVRLAFNPDYSDWPVNSPLFGSAKKLDILQDGTWSTEIHPEIPIAKEDIVIKKNRVSVFCNTSLEELFRNKGITRIMVGGISTDLAVQSTAFDGHDLDFEMVVLEDLCVAANQDDHDQAIRILAKVAKITTSSEVEEFGE
ncbi:MAG: cysteine hydrolase [Patescibacteria group bacterium]